MSLLFALLAALSNAVNVITQHVASITNPADTRGWRFIRYLLKNPLWIVGWVAQLAAFIFQAIALHDGLLSAVQALLMTELVFSLVLRRLWIRQAVRPAAWLSAVVTCAAVSVFITAAEPRGGVATPTSSAWASSMLVCGGFAGVLALLALGGSPARRAAMFATASGTIWGLEASFIKSTTDTLTQYGPGGMFIRWPVYAVVIAGIIGVLLAQVALHVGPLSVSQPLLVIIDPLVSIVLSIHLFGEHFTESPAALTIASVAFMIMCVTTVVLTRTAPQTVGRESG